MNGRTWSISGMAALLSMEVFCIDEHERSEKDRRSSLTFSCGSERKGIWHTSIELFLAVKKKSSRTEVAVASVQSIPAFHGEQTMTGIAKLWNNASAHETLSYNCRTNRI